MAPKEDYTAHQLQVLEGLEAVRKRPGMYIGSTDSRGLMHCLWEILDNSVDEALEGHASNIAIRLFDDGSVQVDDDGRGIPVDEVPGEGRSGVEVVYTKLHAGGKFGGGNYKVSGGLHGVGAAVVNALSSRVDVEVDRNGKTHRIQFRHGVAGRYQDGPAGPSPDSPFVPFDGTRELEIVGDVAKDRTGTRVRYWLDRDFFVAKAAFSYARLVERARQTAFLVPGLAIAVIDHRENAEHPEQNFRFEGGTVDFVDFLAPDSALTATMRLSGEGSYTEHVQVFDEAAGKQKMAELERTCHVDIALRWGTGYDTVEESFVNVVKTPEGGSHVAGFESGLLKLMKQMVEANARRIKLTAKEQKAMKIEKDDILAGLTAVVTVRLPEPQFEGQTKGKLGTPQVRAIVAKIVETQLGDILNSKKRDQKTETSRLLEKIVSEARARVAARLHKEISRRKNALESSSMPAKLADCRSEDIESSELFIVEGDSALGTAKLARNSEFQALLPIRGKILNVQKAGAGKVLENQEIKSIIQVIGAGSGRTFNLESARYGKVIMMTDADVDGAHIRTLLLTLFFRYMRPLIEAGRVYAAVPPLHRLEVAGSGGKKGSYVYTYSEAELHTQIRKLEKAGKRYKEPIQRYKGLGEMDAHQLAETTMDPKGRTLRRIDMEDEQALIEAEAMFEKLMGGDVGPRRKFIVEGAATIDTSMIDA